MKSTHVQGRRVFTLVSTTVLAILFAGTVPAAGPDDAVRDQFADFAVVGNEVFINNGAMILATDQGQARVGSNGLLHLGTNGRIGESGAGGNIQSLGDLSLANGSRIFGNSGNASTNGNLTIGTNGVVEGQASAGGDATLLNGAKVLGVLNVGGTATYGINALAYGGEAHSPVVVPNIEFPVCPVEMTGTLGMPTDLTTGVYSSYALQPGDYGSYAFGSANDVLLQSGEYYFTSLSFGVNNKITLALPVTIHIAPGGMLRIGNGSSMTLTGGGNARDVVYRLGSEATANVGTNAKVAGTFCGPPHSPGADVTVNNGAVVEGAIYAANVHLGTSSRIHSRPADLTTVVHPDLSSFVLLASPGSSPALDLGGTTKVNAGDLGTDGAINTGTSVRLDLSPATRTIAKTVQNLGGSTKVAQLFTDTPAPVPQGTSVVISSQQSFAAGNLPDPATWPAAGPCTPAADPNADKKTTGTFQTLSVDAGAYDEIFVHGNGTLTLTGGRYDVRSFSTNTSVKIHVQAPTTICVSESFDIGGTTKVNDPSFGSGEFVAPDQFVVEYSGTGTATSGTNTTFYGGLLAYPSGSISLGGSSYNKGGFIGKSIKTGTGVQVELATPSPFGP